MQEIQITVKGIVIGSIEVPKGLIDKDVSTRVDEWIENNVEWDYV